MQGKKKRSDGGEGGIGKIWNWEIGKFSVVADFASKQNFPISQFQIFPIFSKRSC
jgi:hypothetical protein